MAIHAIPRCAGSGRAAVKLRGKTTLINVYSGDILLKDIPIALRLGFYIEYIGDTNNTLTITARIFYDNSEIIKILAPIPAGNNPSVIGVQAVDFKIEQEGCIRVVASADGYDDTEVITKKIYKVPIPASTV